MQTYEVAPGESLETLLREISRVARRDREITLVLPPGVNPFAGPEAVKQLDGVIRNYDARLQVQAADPAVVSLFQRAGVAAGLLRGAGNGPPAPPAAGPETRGGFFQRLLDRVAPISGPDPEPEPPPRPAPPPAPAPRAALPPDYGAAPAPRPEPDPGPDEEHIGEGPASLDVTLPMGGQAPPPAGNRVVARMPSSNIDVTMPIGFGSEPAAPRTAPPHEAPRAQEAPAGDLGALGGPPQTAQSVTQAVRAAGLDVRTRSLLLFGMALVRLAATEASAAVDAARQAGASPDDLRLVVEMAQALGGGPSGRLGRRLLGE
jgi:alkylhydroperoxidase/carboxymuconolactone decarboxylase family protein YurZ